MIVEIRDEVVALSGALRRNHWPTLRSAVNVRLRHHPAGIVVDCGGLEALTPEGASTFRDAARHIVASGARIVVANVPEHALRVLRQVPNLGSQLPLASTVAEARASLGLAAAPRAGVPSDPAPAESGDIVVGLLGTGADPHAVAIGCRLGSGAAAAQRRVHLCYLLVVPRNVPLLSALGPEEEEARRVLERMEGAVRAAGRCVPVPRVERTRSPAARLVEVASEVRAAALVLALPPEPSEELEAIAAAVLGRADRPVIVNRLPPPQAAAALPVTAPAAAGPPPAEVAAAARGGEDPRRGRLPKGAR